MDEYKVYFIRHAPTAPNLSGDLVKNYDSYDIIKPLDDRKWHQTVGCYIRRREDLNISDNEKFSDARHFYVLSSPAVRCESTAMYLFPHPDRMKIEWLSFDDDLRELECPGLDNVKFWEVSREEFDSKIHPDINAFDKRVTSIIKDLTYDCEEFSHDIICVTHGLYGRYLYNKLTGKGDDNLYDLINSKSFRFDNLDMIECTVKNGQMTVTNVYRFQK